MHVSDELYGWLRGPGENLTVLATAFAARDKGGSGEHEPLLTTVSYGKGRVFNTALGHGVEQLKSVAFITTYQRGRMGGHRQGDPESACRFPHCRQGQHAAVRSRSTGFQPVTRCERGPDTGKMPVLRSFPSFLAAADQKRFPSITRPSFRFPSRRWVSGSML